MMRQNSHCATPASVFPQSTSTSIATTPKHKQFRHRAAAKRASLVRCAAADDEDAAESAAAGDTEDDADVDLASGVAHAKYIQNVAAIDNPPGELGALMAVLQAQGMTLVSPSDRKGLHPLCVPLAKAAEGGERGGPVFPHTMT